jgi:hypothetical protein
MPTRTSSTRAYRPMLKSYGSPACRVPWRRMQRIAVVLTVAVVGFVSVVWVLQRRMIYFPIPHLGPQPPGVQEATFTTSDGLELGGWFFPAEGTDGRAVLVCNGNAGNRSHRVLLAEALKIIEAVRYRLARGYDASDILRMGLPARFSVEDALQVVRDGLEELRPVVDSIP